MPGSLPEIEVTHQEEATGSPRSLHAAQPFSDQVSFIFEEQVTTHEQVTNQEEDTFSCISTPPVQESSSVLLQLQSESCEEQDMFVAKAQALSYSQSPAKATVSWFQLSENVKDERPRSWTQELTAQEEHLCQSNAQLPAIPPFPEKDAPCWGVASWGHEAPRTNFAMEAECTTQISYNTAILCEAPGHGDEEEASAIHFSSAIPGQATSYYSSAGFHNGVGQGKWFRAQHVFTPTSAIHCSGPGQPGQHSSTSCRSNLEPAESIPAHRVTSFHTAFCCNGPDQSGQPVSAPCWTTDDGQAVLTSPAIHDPAEHDASHVATNISGTVDVRAPLQQYEARDLLTTHALRSATTLPSKHEECESEQPYLHADALASGSVFFEVQDLVISKRWPPQRRYHARNHSQLEHIVQATLQKLEPTGYHLSTASLFEQAKTSGDVCFLVALTSLVLGPDIISEITKHTFFHTGITMLARDVVADATLVQEAQLQATQQPAPQSAIRFDQLPDEFWEFEAEEDQSSDCDSNL